MKEFTSFLFLRLPFLFQTTRAPKFPISPNYDAIKFLLANVIVPAEKFIVKAEKRTPAAPPRCVHQPVEGAGIVAAFPTA